MAYVVVRVGFEYNDEINREPECEGGEPIGVTDSKEKAQSVCKKKNLEAFRTADLSSYGYEPSEVSSSLEIHDYDELPGLFPFLERGRYYGLTPKKSATDAEIEQLYDAFDLLRFYKVIEVDNLG